MENPQKPNKGPLARLIGAEMRNMDLPNLSAPPSDVEGCLRIYAERVEQAVVPYPEASYALIGYTAWPNDEDQRNRWMATMLGRSIAREPPELALAMFTSADTSLPGKLADFERSGGIGVLSEISFSHMTQDLGRTQKRLWRVADILQTIVDMRHEPRVSARGGASVSKAYDVVLGYNVRALRTQLMKDWTHYRDSAHLIAAAAALIFRSRTSANSQFAPELPVAMLCAPEIVLALGLAFQEFGLNFTPHGQRETLLRGESLWRIPGKFTALDLPTRRLSDRDLTYLTTTRRARRKAS